MKFAILSFFFFNKSITQFSFLIFISIIQISLIKKWNKNGRNLALNSENIFLQKSIIQCQFITIIPISRIKNENTNGNSLALLTLRGELNKIDKNLSLYTAGLRTPTLTGFPPIRADYVGESQGRCCFEWLINHPFFLARQTTVIVNHLYWLTPVKVHFFETLCGAYCVQYLEPRHQIKTILPFSTFFSAVMNTNLWQTRPFHNQRGLKGDEESTAKMQERKRFQSSLVSAQRHIVKSIFFLLVF